MHAFFTVGGKATPGQQATRKNGPLGWGWPPEPLSRQTFRIPLLQ